MPNIKALDLKVSDKKIFPCLPYIRLCQTCDPQGWDKCWPQGVNLYKLGISLLGDATYKIPRL